MKLGVAVCGGKVLPSEVAKEFYNQGIKIVELEYNKQFVIQEIRQIKNLDLDLSIHCPYENLRFNYSIASFILNNPKFYFRKSQIKEIEKGFSVAEKLEATHYVMHGGIFPRGYFRFNRLRRKDKIANAFIKAFKPFFIKAKYSEVKVVLENLTRYNFFSDVSDIMNVQNEFPWLGFCLDFGHSELTYQTDLLKKLRIGHVHASDNDLVVDSHLILGKGNLDFIKLKKILKKQKFKGKVLAECLDVNDAIKSFEYLKKYF